MDRKTMNRVTTLKALVVMCVFFGSVGSLTQREKYTLDEGTGIWFKYHQIPAVYTDAFVRCKSEGAMLASPWNEEFTRIMTSIVSKKRLCGSCAIFTGINSFFSKGNFFTAEGYPLSALPVTWAPGSPDNFENSEDCLVMLPNGDLDDRKCNNTYSYICHKNSTKNLTNPICGNNDPAYALDARSGSCYKFHNVGLNWFHAHAECVSEGGYLAIPNSPTEANILREIFSKYPDSNIFSSAKAVIALGFHDQFQQGFWLTLEGQTLVEAGYAEFDNGQPDNDRRYDGGSRCGAMFRNGRLDDIWCKSVTVPFVCEKDPSFIFN